METGKLSICPFPLIENVCRLGPLSPNMDPLTVRLSSYAAYENIINQCFADKGSSFTGDNPNGKWQVGNEWYWITLNNSVSIIGEDAANDEFTVQNGQDADEYVLSLV